MLRYGRYVFSFRSSRCFSATAAAENAPISTFLTTESNPVGVRSETTYIDAHLDLFFYR